jgi:hypothetical protein
MRCQLLKRDFIQRRILYADRQMFGDGILQGRRIESHERGGEDLGDGSQFKDGLRGYIYILTGTEHGEPACQNDWILSVKVCGNGHTRRKVFL